MLPIETVDRIRGEGYADGMAGQYNNPYANMSAQWSCYMDGYEQAMYEIALLSDT